MIWRLFICKRGISIPFGPCFGPKMAHFQALGGLRMSLPAHNRRGGRAIILGYRGLPLVPNGMASLLQTTTSMLLTLPNLLPPLLRRGAVACPHLLTNQTSTTPNKIKQQKKQQHSNVFGKQWGSVLLCAKRSTSTVIVGRLFSLWAMTCCGSLQSTSPRAAPCPVCNCCPTCLGNIP